MIQLLLCMLCVCHYIPTLFFTLIVDANHRIYVCIMLMMIFFNKIQQQNTYKTPDTHKNKCRWRGEGRRGW